MKPMSRWQRREVRHANLRCQQSPDEIWTGKMHELTRAVRKNSTWLSGWVDGLTNKGFQSVQQASSRMQSRETDRADCGPSSTSRGLLSEAHFHWGAAAGQRGCLHPGGSSAVGLRTVVQPAPEGWLPAQKHCDGDCNDRQCCMAHLEALVTDDNEAQGCDIWLCSGWHTPPLLRSHCRRSSTARSSCGKHLDGARSTCGSLCLSIASSSRRCVLLCRAVRLPPPPQAGAPPRGGAQAGDVRGGGGARIAAAYDGDAVRDETVRRILKHPQVRCSRGHGPSRNGRVHRPGTFFASGSRTTARTGPTTPCGGSTSSRSRSGSVPSRRTSTVSFASSARRQSTRSGSAPRQLRRSAAAEAGLPAKRSGIGFGQCPYYVVPWIRTRRR